jgi:hypothetical protein
MHLSPSARRLLRDVAQRLRHEPEVQKVRRKAVNEVVAWLDEQHIDPGQRLSHAWLRFDRELLAQIEEALELSGEAPLDVNLSGLTSTEQARHGSREEKGVRDSPRRHRVLTSLPAGASRPGIAQDVREVLDLDRRRLDLAAFDVLVQIENLDGFYTLPANLPALAPWSCPLVLYRGDKHYGGGFAAVADAWMASGKPHLYLGDFDARGVSIAISSRATHLLLPPLAWLAQRASGEHLPPEQQAYQPALRDHAAELPEGHPLAGYLGLLLGEQRGLRQQWYGDSELEAVPVGAMAG